MGQGYAKATATIAAATATRLSAILTAEGYTGSMIGKYLRIDAGAAGILSLYRGADSLVSAVNGIDIAAMTPPVWERIAPSPELAVDPANIWLFSTAGGDFGLTFEPF